MRLLATSDLHLHYKSNRAALEALPAHPKDWLILAGDLGETGAHMKYCFDVLLERFAKLVWVPGNHELYTVGRDPVQLRGQARYEWLVQLCQSHGVLTPEDPWPLWPGAGPATRIAPLFLLYDYSFAPDGMAPEQAVRWAAEHGIRATDERLLHPDPFPSRQAWCAARVAITQRRLDSELGEGERVVLINHYPLRRDLVRFNKLARFLPWCGTRATEDWHTRYPVDVVVSGHLHMRATDWRDGVRFEEVALGYPRHWQADKTLEDYLRVILPRARPPEGGFAPPVWHR